MFAAGEGYNIESYRNPLFSIKYPSLINNLNLSFISDITWDGIFSRMNSKLP